jgi:aryl-alcohol dehydrogenase-like predicted oxidoreductase
MEYRRLGRSGVRVSAVSLGSWLTYGHKTDEKQAVRCVRRAFELGVNLFDTANVYARGRAERVLGNALETLPRDEYLVATKAYFPIGDGPNQRGLSRKHIFEQVGRSLTRLRTGYIDLFQCHRYDADTPVDETLRAIDDLIERGDILYGGVSEWTAPNIAEGVRVSRELSLRPLVSNQPQYHILQRRIEINGVLDTCRQEGLGILAFSPLAQGVLTGKYDSVDDVPPESRAADPDGAGFIRRWLTEENVAAARTLKGVADQAGLTLPKLAIAWCLRRPEVSSAIVGASTVEHVEENVAAADVELDDETLAAVDAALVS